MSPLLHQGKKPFLFPDHTAFVAKKQAAFTEVKHQLHSCPSFKFDRIFAAVFMITFEDPAAAMDFAKANIKSVVSSEASS